MPKPIPMPPAGKMVVFYDGLCPLCDRFVNRLMRLDKKGRLLFSPLQGRTAAGVVGADNTVDLACGGSIIVWDKDGFHSKSSAVLRIGARLGGLHRLWGVGRILPRQLRDRVYDWVARNRYKWFGRLRACRTPDESRQTRFLP